MLEIGGFVHGGEMGVLYLHKLYIGTPSFLVRFQQGCYSCAIANHCQLHLKIVGR